MTQDKAARLLIRLFCLNHIGRDILEGIHTGDKVFGCSDLCTQFVPGYFKTLVNFGDALAPTSTLRFDEFAIEETLNGSNLINSLVGLLIHRHRRLSNDANLHLTSADLRRSEHPKIMSIA